MDSGIGRSMLSRMTSDLLSLSVVPRWGIIGTVRPQSVAEHSYGVAIIARSIAMRVSCPISVPVVLEWALLHDGAECVTGDIPSIIKHKPSLPLRVDLFILLREVEDGLCPWYAEARDKMEDYPLERAIVKIADLLEGASFIHCWGHGPIGASASRHAGVKEINYISAKMVSRATRLAEEHAIGSVVAGVVRELPVAGFADVTI